MEMIIPDDVQFILTTLNDNGYKAYIVGGCVRDLLLGIEPHDWDICTSALPEQTQAVFDGYKIIPTGIKHGTITILINDSQYEVTTFRIDRDYQDNRHPSEVVFTTDLIADLSRRDFTINAMAYNPNENKDVYDFFGGVNDLLTSKIRCVGSPQDRFEEDALRIMRAIRFSIRFGFDIEENTLNAMMDKKCLLGNISAERICDEVCKTLSTKRAFSDEQFEILCNILAVRVPELLKAEIESACLRLNTAIKNDGCLNLRIALLFDFTPEDTLRILTELRFSNDVIHDVLNIQKYGNYILNNREWENNDGSVPGYYERCLLHWTGMLSIDSVYYAISHCNEFYRLYKLRHRIVACYLQKEVCSLSQLAINGNDLKEIGIGEGYLIGKLLNRLLDEVMRDNVPNDRQILLNRAKEIL